MIRRRFPPPDWLLKRHGLPLSEPATISAELLDDPEFDVLTHLARRVEERLNDYARKEADDLLRYGDPQGKKPVGILRA